MSSENEKIFEEYKKALLENISAGSTVFFGNYEQDRDLSTGKEDIEWIVLKVEDNRAFLVSKYALDYKPYNDTAEAITWENCTLRTWLNTEFLNEAFSEEEQAIIELTTLASSPYLQGEELLLPPNVYMNLFDEEYNGMISLYTRDLGMILNYEETWINSKEFSTNSDEMLVTLFVPDTSAELTFGDESINLGEYLRKREEADHMKWDDDPAKMKLKCVKQIKNSVDVSVRKHFNPDQFETHSESDMSEFAGVFGEKLFPLNKAKPRTGGGGGGSGGGEEDR